MSIAPPAAAEPRLRIRCACPECGAPIRYREGDRVLGCDYCGIHLALPEDAAMPHYAVPSAGLPANWQESARALLSENEVRSIRRWEPIRWVYVPYYRLCAETWHCWLTAAEPSDEIAWDVSSPAPAAGLSAFDYRVGWWDHSILGSPSLSWSDGVLGPRTQVCELVPLWEFIDSSQSSEEAPGCKPSPNLEVLSPEIAPETAREKLHQLMLEACSKPSEEILQQALYAPFARLQQISVPYAIVPFTGPMSSGAILLDGLTGRVRALLHPQDLAALSRQAKMPRPPAADLRPPGIWASDGTRKGCQRPESPLIPLICPDCSGPLPWIPRARIHDCQICRKLWLPRKGGMQRILSRCLRDARRRGTSTMDGRSDRANGGCSDRSIEGYLPFYRVTIDAKRSSFIPAFRGRHPRSIWRLTLALSRGPRDWVEVEEEVSPITPVEIDPAEAPALIPFLSACVREDLTERPAAGNTAVDLVWIPFRRKGREWIEPASGLGLNEAAVTPWKERTAKPDASLHHPILSSDQWRLRESCG